MAISPGELVEEIKNAASQVLNKDIATLSGFSERQLKAIAQQAALIEAGIITGEITEETRQFFLDSLKDMTSNFVKTLGGLMVVEVEKVWNAVVGVIWSAIETATGLALGRPTRG